MSLITDQYPYSALSPKSWKGSSLTTSQITSSHTYLTNNLGSFLIDPAFNNSYLLFPLSTKTTHLTTKLTSSSSTSAKLSIPFLTIYCSTNCRTSVSLVISSIGSAHICPADLNQLLLTALFPLNSQSPQAYRKEASLAPSCLSSLSMIFQIPYNQQPLSCSQTTPSASKLSLPYTTRVYSKMTSLHSPVGALSGNSHSTAQSANC